MDRVYSVILVAASVFGLIRFSRLSLPFRLLVFLLIYTFIHEWPVHWKWHSELLYWIYALVQALVYPLIIYLALRHTGKKKTMLALIVVQIIVVAIFSPSHYGDKFPSVLLLVTSPVLLLSAIVLYWHLINSDFATPMTHKSLFWFNSAFFLYIAITITHLSLYNYLLETKTARALSQSIHTWVTYTYYSVIGFSLWMDARSLND